MEAFDQETGRGVGCYLSIKGDTPEDFVPDLEHFQTRVFTETSPARLEIQAALWALGETAKTILEPKATEIVIVTDSKTIDGLLARRERLEREHFIGKRQGKELGNADLYREFYTQYDRLSPRIVWVRGHVSHGNRLETLFSHVDRHARKALRLARDE